MEGCRATAGLQIIPRLSGVMSRKGQPVQTLSLQPGILATLGHTRLVLRLHKGSVHQVADAMGPLQGDMDLGQYQVAMEGLEAIDLDILIVSMEGLEAKGLGRLPI